MIFFFFSRPTNTAAFARLKNLYLSHTHLETLPRDFFDILPSRTQIELTGNKWNCDERLQFLPTTIRNSNVKLKDVNNVVCFTPSRMKGTRIVDWRPDFQSVPSPATLETTTGEINTWDFPTWPFDKREFTTGKFTVWKFSTSDTATSKITSKEN